ncbi:MAG: glycosyltransferase, partial [Hyphomonadaceae bacterium]|nr:glycosyltransferase [Hyphomonadaceae bacterium]
MACSGMETPCIGLAIRLHAPYRQQPSGRRRPMPLVSIIIPAWNAAAFIRYPIQSCLRQSLPDLEVLVVDDASTDATV